MASTTIKEIIERELQEQYALLIDDKPELAGTRLDTTKAFQLDTDTGDCHVVSLILNGNNGIYGDFVVQCNIDLAFVFTQADVQKQVTETTKLV